MAVAEAKYIWLDGEVVPWAEAKIHVQTDVVLRGANVFEGVRAYWNADQEQLFLFRHEDHLIRLQQSAKVMRIQAPWGPDEITAATLDLIRANAFRESIYVRTVLYIGEGQNYGWDPAKVRFGAFIIAGPRPPKAEPGKGVRSCVSTWQRISDNATPARVKAGANYQNARFANIAARLDGYDGPPVLLNQQGEVAEGPGECLCLIRRGTLITPPVTADILESVTRATLIELADRELSLPIEVRPVDRTELYIADEVFFCGTAAEITPVISIDHYPVGDERIGPLTAKLQEQFFAAATGRLPAYHHWLLPAY